MAKGKSESHDQVKGLTGKTGIFPFVSREIRNIISPVALVCQVALLAVVPVLLVILSPKEDFSTHSPVFATTWLGATLATPLFLWTLGVALAVAVGAISAPLLAEEVETGRMLIAASAPISRSKLFLSKYLAAAFYGGILVILSVFCTGIIAVGVISANFLHFVNLVPLLLMGSLYGVLVVFSFAGVGVTISVLARKSRTASQIALGLALGVFLGMTLLKIFAYATYAGFFLYHFDPTYHLGNIFVLFLQGSGVLQPFSSWQAAFGDLTGVFQQGGLTGSSQNFEFVPLGITGYYPPLVSLLDCILTMIVCLFVGWGRFRKQDIFGI